MKKVKFIFIFFLILLSFVFSGEFFQNYLNSFTSQFYYIDISEDRDFTQPEIQAEVSRVSEKYNIDFFTVQRINESSHSCVSTVYCSKKAQDRLKKEYACGKALSSNQFIIDHNEELADLAVQANLFWPI